MVRWSKYYSSQRIGGKHIIRSRDIMWGKVGKIRKYHTLETIHRGVMDFVDFGYSGSP